MTESILNLYKFADYWCTNVNDEFIILCFRRSSSPTSQGCIKTENGITFDNTNYKLNKDYNRFAKMTTFNGLAVIVGIVGSDIRTEFGKEVVKEANKYVEIFDGVSNQWLLKSPKDTSHLLNWITQFALVPLKNNLLHLGGNDIGSAPASSAYHSNYEISSFQLDSVYQKWIKMGTG